MSDRPWDNVGKVQPYDAAVVERILKDIEAPRNKQPCCEPRIQVICDHCLLEILTTALAEARREAYNKGYDDGCHGTTKKV